MVLVGSGTTAGNTVVSSGGLLVFSSGGATAGGGAVQSGGAVEFVSQVVGDGDTLVLPSPGSLPGMVLGVNVDAGAKLEMVDTEVASGGLLSLGVNISGVTVSAGGRLLGPGALVDAAHTDIDWGLASGVGLAAGVSLAVESGGVASGVIQDGIDSLVTIDSGGRGVGIQELAALARVTVAVGGVTTGTSVDAGADQVVFGVASATRLSGGIEDVEAGGAASGSQISSGGQQVIEGGGGDTHTLIFGGGVETLSGGSASVASVGNGGALRISSGGVASATTVYRGGSDAVFSGGVARRTVLSGGTEYDYGVTSATLVDSGGHEVVEAHATASNAGIGVGGLLTVWSGGAVAGGLKLFGGRAVISGTAAAGQTVTFAGATAVLELDNLASFSAKISGMSQATQQVDLGGFAFSSGETVSWAQSGTSGTLTVTDGAKVAHLTLIGTYVTGDFHLSNDTHGGTLVDDPPVLQAAAPAAAAGFVQAIASLAGDYTACVRSGGEAAVIVSPVFLTAATSGR